MTFKHYKHLKELHPRILIDYAPRFIGYLFIAAVLLSIITGDGNTNPLPYILIAIQTFIWPPVALLLSSKSPNPKWLRLGCLLADCFVTGCWIAYISFPVWPTTLLLIITYLNMANLGVNDIKGSLLGLLSSGLGFLFMTPFFGLEFREQTNIMTDILTVTGYLIFFGLLGFLTSYRAQILELTKSKLREANVELDEIDNLVHQTSASSNLDKVMKIIIDPLSKIFNFDKVTVQLLDQNQNELLYLPLYGTELLSEVLTKELEKIKVNLESDALSAKVFNEGKAIYINDVKDSDTIPTAEYNLRTLFLFSSILLLPLTIKHKSIGIIGFYSVKKMNLKERTIEKIKRHVAHASLVINNAILYNTITEERKEMNSMNEQLTQISKHLSKYISPQVYESIIQKNVVEIGAVRKHMTVFFSDIVGFSSLSDAIEPEVLTHMINTYFDEMTKIVLKHGGTVDKYIGDAIMVFFGDPTTNGPKEDAMNCVSMALEMREQLKELKAKWESEGISQDLKIRIGINSGYCAVGNFGSEYRMIYTVIGNQVNLASRLQHIGAPGEITVCETTYLLIRTHINCAKGETIEVKGIGHPVRTYTVTGFKEEDKEE